MLTYADFLQIAEYANENWKGNFTEEEVKDNAKIYYADFQWSKENNKVAESIKTLCENLMEDAKENEKIAHHKDSRTCPEIHRQLIQSSLWLHQIESELDM